MANLGYRHYAGVKGSKEIYVGQDSNIYNYTDIQTALNEAQYGDTIFIAPGTYTVTTTIDWSKPVTLYGMGMIGDVIIGSALTTRTVMLNMPATGSASAKIFKAYNVKFYNSSTGDAIEIDNDGGLAQDMYIDFQNCSFVSDSGVAVDLDQTTTTKDIFINISGKKTLNYIGASTLSPDKAGSKINIENMDCGVFTFGAAAKAYIFNMFDCSYASQAQTAGGGAGALHNLIGNTYYTAAGQLSAATAGLANDFDATSTEYWASHSAA